MDNHHADASASSNFDLAAIACGHDPSTTTGAEDARHDDRVWDLLTGVVGEHIANARAAIANSSAVSW